MSKKILVVEDDELLNQLITRCLRGADYEMTGVRRWADADRYLEKQEQHLIITDVRLPDGDNLTRLPRLSEHQPVMRPHRLRLGARRGRVDEGGRVRIPWSADNNGRGAEFGAQSASIDIDYFNGTIEELYKRYRIPGAGTNPSIASAFIKGYGEDGDGWYVNVGLGLA